MKVKYYVKGGNAQKSPDLGWGGTPYYEKMDYKGSSSYLGNGVNIDVAGSKSVEYDFPVINTHYNYKNNPYIVATSFFPDRSYGVEEYGNINGIDVNIRNKYNKDGIKQFSDTIYNGIPVNTPIGRDLQRRVESFGDGERQGSIIGKPILGGDKQIIGKPILGGDKQIIGKPILGGDKQIIGKPILGGDNIPMPPRQLDVKPKVKPLEPIPTRLYQQGGQMANQLGQITKAAIEMANAFKKQGVISEIAGEQAIAQAFSNNQKEAQVFASFIKNVQSKKQAPTQEELQSVLELFTKLGIVK